MKFGIGADAVNAVSLKIIPGFSAETDQNDERFVVNRFQDGTVEVLDFGSRVSREVDFTIVNLLKADYITLLDYLDANSGLKIKVTEENVDEKLFTETWTPTTYYCYVLGFSQLQEEDFSVSRGLFSVKVSLALAGEGATDEINAADSSEFDLLVEVDTTNATYRQSGTPDGSDGQRWFDTDDNKLYEWYGGVGGGWELLYTVAADDAAYGFAGGIFKWAAFSNVGSTYIAGLLNYKSIQIGTRRIDISDGPNISFREGSSFAVDDSQRFWLWVINTGIVLFNAKVAIKLYKKAGAVYTTLFTGRNRTNGFSYTDYKFEIESELLNDAGVFPAEIVDSSVARYVNTSEVNVGKAVFRTYGTWKPAAWDEWRPFDRATGEFGPVAAGPRRSDFARLQNISGDTNIHRTDIKGDLDTTTTIITADTSIGTLAELQALIADGKMSLMILTDTVSASLNPNESRTVLSVAYADPNFTFTVDAAFPTPAGVAADRVSFQLIKNVVQFQSGEAVSGGFDDFSDGLRVHSLTADGKELREVASAGLEVNTDKNIISLNNKDSVTSGEAKSFAPIDPTPTMPIANKVRITDNDDNDLGETVSSGADATSYWNTIAMGAVHDYWALTCRYKDVLTGVKTNIWNSAYSLNPALEYVQPTWITTKAVLAKANYIKNSLNNSLAFVYQVTVPAGLTERKDIAHLKLALDCSLNVKLSQVATSERNTSCGVKIKMRMRSNEGGAVTEDSGWSYDIPTEQMGLGYYSGAALANNGVVAINNFPDSAGGFAEDDNLDSFTDFRKFEIQHTANSIGTLPTGAGVINGDKAWVFRSHLEDDLLYERASGNWDLADPQPVVGDLINLFNIAASPKRATIYRVVETGTYKKVDDVTVLYSSQHNTLRGRELFDFDGYLENGSLTALKNRIELIFLVNEIDGFQWRDHAQAVQSPNSVRLDGIFVMYRAPQFYYATNADVLEAETTGSKIVYSACIGDAAAGSSPALIAADIMADCYPGKYSAASLTALAATPSRSVWSWHKQFYESAQVSVVLKELLWNLWACAVVDENDQIVFKSLNRADYTPGTPQYAITEADYILDSIQEPEFRDSDKIYQRYELSHSFNPPSVDSKHFPGYLDRKVIDKNVAGAPETQKLIRASRALYGLNNTLKKDFSYFYDPSVNFPSTFTLPIFPQIVEHFCFNAWTIKLDVSLTFFLANSVSLMDYISVTSYFHTALAVVEGWVVGISLGKIYDGKVSLTIFIPQPPGVLGPIEDKFKDALTTARDVTGWQTGKDWINDAGTTARTIEDYDQDDALTSERVL